MRIHRGSAGQYGSIYEYCNFAYDGYGRRTSKVYSYDSNPGSTSDYSYMYTTTYDYDTSGRLIHEICVEANTYTGGSTSTRDITYLYDESGIIGAIQKRGTVEETFYFDRNIKGDVVGIYNASGTRIAKYSYDSWGNSKLTTLLSNNFSGYNPIRYRGYYFDAESGLYFLNARYYNPTWRRFISPDDTAYLNPETPNGLNLYAYCNNDPVNYSDPSGKSAEGIIIQSAILLLSYITFSIASLWDEDIRKDMKALGWNPFNNDENLVLDAEKISFYKGVPVIKFDHGVLTSFSLGGIFLNNSNPINEMTIKHEYGHSVQQMILGHDKYLYSVFLPSTIYNMLSRDYTALADKYFSMPWERTADLFGNAEHEKYEDYSLLLSLLYLLFFILF